MSSRHGTVNRSERGFSVVKLLVVVAVTGFIVFNGGLVMYASYTNSKVQSCFDEMVNNSRLMHANATRVRSRLNDLFGVQYIDHDDLPDAFFEHLNIHATGDMLEISSRYSVTVWPFGKVQDIDQDGTYDPDTLTGMDMLRDKTRIDLDFKPYAISSADGS